ncbi:MAG TPA: winged helix-turn-helix domain-containing protein [Phenylobacterium sp.]|uniref:winged helix-turn-helix domain-containing protein n=1 Tax=Phenylobacterium sp. TaxID=1871053 RepID=UPI002F94F6B3
MNATAVNAANRSDARSGPIYQPGSVIAFADTALCFRTFRLMPAARILLCEGRPVEIGSRAFDLLHILLRSQGAVVERETIMRQVWPTTIVDESNLRSQVSQVRKASGVHRDLLKTVPGRGYLLAAEVAPQGEHREWPTPRVTRPEPMREFAEAEGLRSLLRSVLDELCQMRRELGVERELRLGAAARQPLNSARALPR